MTASFGRHNVELRNQIRAWPFVAMWGKRAPRASWGLLDHFGQGRPPAERERFRPAISWKSTAHLVVSRALQAIAFSLKRSRLAQAVRTHKADGRRDVGYHRKCMRANDGRFRGRFGARFGARFGPMQIVEGPLLGALGIALLVACSSSTQPPMKSSEQRPDGGAALDGGGDATVSDASGSEVADVSASEASMESSADDAEFVYPTNLDAGSDAALPPPVPQS